ncbi:MAG: DUF4917 family protein, partial [Bacteroidales bacterium]
FLQKYIANKIKMDFMQATQEIVKSKIKHIYEKKKEGVSILLKNFSKFFTLNYDPFLYISLLRFTSSDKTKNTTVAFPQTLKFIGEDLDKQHNDIYTEIKEARENGSLKIIVGEHEVEREFSKLTKTHLLSEITLYSRENEKNWKKTDIEKVIEKILKEEQTNEVLSKIDDGSIKQNKLFSENADFIFNSPETQNLFFLHGAFHIYRDGEKNHYKITQSTDKALYDRLEDIINNNDKDIICVFQSTDKLSVIQSDTYLSNCLNKLGSLSGSLVILGSSLDENDNHIFEKINNSPITTVYISAVTKELKEKYERACEIFLNKNIVMYDAATITYELPKVND